MRNAEVGSSILPWSKTFAGLSRTQIFLQIQSAKDFYVKTRSERFLRVQGAEADMLRLVENSMPLRYATLEVVQTIPVVMSCPHHTLKKE
ncbi:hypothetical protein Y032_0036g3260 [Ancylostoma ceylanicum]|uniref:Uncharacterized protein n=1 Tax=Ancylostoma ceylanicum TaxID=53326 RepID=A0A016UKC0_9BILA|nr:hypothetical protein Y032_0036g3260 [Ancylostoma ceylanicum]